jgi:hypothetical protein
MGALVGMFFTLALEHTELRRLVPPPISVEVRSK